VLHGGGSVRGIPHKQFNHKISERRKIMSAVGAGAPRREEKHIRIFNAFKSLQGSVSEMEDLLTRVRGSKPGLEALTMERPEKPNPDTLSGVLSDLPSLIGNEAERLVSIRTRLTEELF